MVVVTVLPLLSEAAEPVDSADTSRDKAGWEVGFDGGKVGFDEGKADFDDGNVDDLGFRASRERSRAFA
jgi:opacity protein-like surface antigen